MALSALGVRVCLGLTAWSYGWGRLAAPASTLRVDAATSDESVRLLDGASREQALPVLEAYARRIDELARRGVHLVVLPEKFVGVAPDYEEEAIRILSESSRRNRVTVVAGLNRIGRAPKRNTAFVIGSDGVAPGRVRQGIPPAGLRARLRTRSVARHVLRGRGNHGCCDLQGHGFSRLAAAPCRPRRPDRLGARLGISLKYGHARVERTVIRGVEGGFAVVRSAQEGMPTISDHLGRILAERASSEDDAVLLVGDVPLGPGNTPYSLAGDWLGATSVLLMATLLVVGPDERAAWPADETDGPLRLRQVIGRT